MREQLGVACAFLSGIAFGLAMGWKSQPKVLLVELELSEQRVANMIHELNEHRPVQPAMPEDMITVPAMSSTPIEEIKENFKRDLVDYATAVEPYVPTKALAGDIIFISPEAYLEDDSYDKIALEVYRDDLNYVITADGDTVDDIYEVVDDEVLAELTGKTCLFIRNERKKADYEVTWGQP